MTTDVEHLLAGHKATVGSRAIEALEDTTTETTKARPEDQMPGTRKGVVEEEMLTTIHPIGADQATILTRTRTDTAAIVVET